MIERTASDLAQRAGMNAGRLLGTIPAPSDSGRR